MVKFNFHGRVGETFYSEDFGAPDLVVAIEEARRRLKKYRSREGGDGPVSVELTPVHAKVWEVRDLGGELREASSLRPSLLFEIDTNLPY